MTSLFVKGNIEKTTYKCPKSLYKHTKNRQFLPNIHYVTLKNTPKCPKSLYNPKNDHNLINISNSYFVRDVVVRAREFIYGI